MPASSKRKVLKFWLKFKPLFWVIVLIFLFWQAFVLVKPVLNFADENGINSSFLYSLIFSKNFPLNQQSGRTNFLLLGIAGANHQADDLTDTMIFFSLEAKKNQALLISLPRDVWSPTLKDKINSAYHYGEEKKQGGGLILSKLIVEETLGQPVHYAILIDLSSLKEAIDILGGVEIEVKHAFDDDQFPIAGKENDLCNGDPQLACRYEHLHFDQGWQKMNGERALKYIRSRNAEGEEGGDFARANRQQKLLLAIKNKVLSPSIIFNPAKVKALIEIFSQGIKTDLNLAEGCFLAKPLLRIRQDEIKKLVLEESFFIIPPLWQYGKWVLVPPNEDYTPIHQFIEKQLESL